MITFFVLTGIFAFFGQIAVCIYKATRPIKVDPYQETVQRLFYNSPEENQRIDDANQNRSLFRYIFVTAVQLAALALLYWLCLYFQAP